MWSNPYPTLHHCYAPCCQRSKPIGISIGALIGQDDSPKKSLLVGCLRFFWGKGERTLGCPPSPKRRIIGEPNEKCRILVVAITGKGAHLKYTCRIGPKEICHFFQQHSGFQIDVPYLENNLLLTSINSTPKNRHSCLKNCTFLCFTCHPPPTITFQ